MAVVGGANTGEGVESEGARCVVAVVGGANTGEGVESEGGMWVVEATPLFCPSWS